MAFSEEMDAFRNNKRVYEVWPGKNRFLFGGQLMTGPWSDCGPNTCVWTIILGPVGLFFWFVGPRLWIKFPMLVVLVGIFFFWTLFALIMTGWSDPGIIPRGSRADAWRLVLQVRSRDAKPGVRVPRFEEINMRDPLPASLYLEVDGELLPHRYCRTCNIYKPPRASHCSDCDNCCKEFDHHCPFVGNCVGERNYGAFCAFLICVVALLVSVMASIVMTSADIKGGERVNAIFAVIICGYSGLMFFVIGGFSLFHCFLVLTGKTTKQKLKGDKEAHSRTMSCINRPPSLIDPTAFIATRDLEDGAAHTAPVKPGSGMRYDADAGADDYNNYESSTEDSSDIEQPLIK